MSAMIAGAAGGMLVASVFVSAGTLMLFSLAKDPPPHLASVVKQLSGPLVFGVVVLAYPTWAMIGAVMGLAYLGVDEVNPGSGMGSPNLAFTLVVVVTALALAVPLLLLFRRMAAGVLAIALSFAGAFGWFLPHFAT
ncbi:MAG: hypothetical protein IH956_05025 [Chloroflexi bacterium]|nr:hypothetical protein [Chloroflexota bacterium]